MTKVVVTGLGAVVPHGDDIDNVYERVIRGENECGRITRFDPTGYACQIGSEVRYSVEAPSQVGPYSVHNHALKFTAGAADRALRYAGLEAATGDAMDRRSIVLSTGVGPANIDFLGPIALRVHGLDSDPYKSDLEAFYGQAPEQAEAQGLDEFHLDTAAPLCAVQLGAAHVYNTASACASGSHAVADAAAMIARGESDVVLAGGVCTPVTRVLVPGFAMLQALSTRNDDPAHASRPFDSGRDGFVMGEGAAMLVLESEDHAKARGATILAEVAGWGYSCDSYRLTDPHPEGVGMALCMTRAMECAGVGPEAIDHVNAHGTSTPYNDAAETLAIKKALGERAYKVPVSSNKSMFGHLIHAAGSLEGCLAVKTILGGVIPPTINYETPDPDCDLDYVPNDGREAQVDTVLKNSFGFGGMNVSVVYRRYTG
ncbi:MAG TPA: beta-ketoacyl-[acyl-carrier-protein] synthase II [Deltaproteobacteria bacterium]|nr:beta-ketoacyl-[acyl-carrier-protein] synthase II [Deltaproteobacteria bacterium]HCP48435.1 beta-ketoacyl-[acyl-carrier-protein] synthase II [Deltaproteobacteria bacterium]